MISYVRASVKCKMVMLMLAMFIGMLTLPVIAQAKSVTLMWDYTQGSDPAVKFRVYREVGCAGNFVAVGDILYPTLTFVDSTVVDGGLYCYHVSAINSQGGESTFSNVVQFQVPTTLTPPTNLRGTVGP